MSYTFYCSGASRIPDYLGLAHAGINVGVSIQEMGDEGIQRLIALADEFPTLKVFVDSGAFAEVQYDSEGVRSIREPITHEGWVFRLSKYDEIADKYRKRLIVVAPDCVGDQEETLKRLSAYKEQILSLMSKCSVIVPLQTGGLSLSEMYYAIVAILGRSDFVTGIPCKKGATSLGDLYNLLYDIRPCPMHLLGVSPSSSKWPKIKMMLDEVSYPIDQLSMDAVRLRALVMRKTHLGVLTKKIDHYKAFGNSTLDAKILAIKDLKDIILKDVSKGAKEVHLWNTDVQ